LKNFSKNCTKKPVGRKHGGDKQKNQEQAPQISRNKETTKQTTTRITGRQQIKEREKGDHRKSH
jgi:hypothetical protein